IGLNEGQKYVMLDMSEMNIGLPERFIEAAQQSFFTHDNLLHTVLYVDSGMLRSISVMIAKLTRRQNRLTLHKSREEALEHLHEIVADKP
ncbi:MAG: hypothetical protein ACPG7F_22140, partial [Aggregatilineales bacterium]